MISTAATTSNSSQDRRLFWPICWWKVWRVIIGWGSSASSKGGPGPLPPRAPGRSGRGGGRRREAQVHGGDLVRRGLGVEEFPPAEAQGTGDEHAGERRDGCVVVQDGGVVVLAREADLVLRGGQLLLELEHV